MMARWGAPETPVSQDKARSARTTRAYSRRSRSEDSRNARTCTNATEMSYTWSRGRRGSRTFPPWQQRFRSVPRSHISRFERDPTMLNRSDLRGADAARTSPRASGQPGREAVLVLALLLLATASFHAGAAAATPDRVPPETGDGGLACARSKIAHFEALASGVQDQPSRINAPSGRCTTAWRSISIFLSARSPAEPRSRIRSPPVRCATSC